MTGQIMKISETQADAMEQNIALADTQFGNARAAASIRSQILGIIEEPNNTIDSVPPRVLDRMKTYYIYPKLSDTGDAVMGAKPTDGGGKIDVNLVETTVQLPFFMASFEVDKFDEANPDYNVRSTLVERATRNVLDLLDETIYYKVTDAFGTLGIYNDFTTTSTGTDWTSGTGATISNDVVKFVNAIPAQFRTDNMQALVLHLNSAQYGELFKADAYGNNAYDLVKKTFPNLRIVLNKRVTATTGLLYPYRNDVVERVIGFPVTGMPWRQSSPMSYEWKVFTSSRVVVYEVTAGVKISTI